MKERFKRTIRAALDRAQWPVIFRLEVLRDDIRGLDQRLVELGGRIDELERLAQTTGMRASGAAEEIAQLVESTTRVGQRVAEVERLLGASAGER